MGRLGWWWLDKFGGGELRVELVGLSAFGTCFTWVLHYVELVFYWLGREEGRQLFEFLHWIFALDLVIMMIING